MGFCAGMSWERTGEPERSLAALSRRAVRRTRWSPPYDWKVGDPVEVYAPCGLGGMGYGGKVAEVRQGKTRTLLLVAYSSGTRVIHKLWWPTVFCSRPKPRAPFVFGPPRSGGGR